MRRADLLAHNKAFIQIAADLMHVLRQTDNPVLSFVPNQIETMRGKLSDLREVVMLEGCGHWTQQERPDEVNRALINFIQAL